MPQWTPAKRLGAAAAAAWRRRHRSPQPPTIDLHRLAFARLDLGQHPGHRRRNLRIHFVGRNLKQRLVFLNCIA